MLCYWLPLRLAGVVRVDRRKDRRKDRRNYYGRGSEKRTSKEAEGESRKG